MIEREITQFSVGSGGEEIPGRAASPSVVFHGEALARSPWLEQWGGWIAGGFIGLFALLLVAMNLFGQIPGQSFLLKVTSDVFQTTGQWIGCLFCLWIAWRLYQVARQGQQSLSSVYPVAGGTTDKNDIHSATRAALAWLCLGVGCACYGSAGIVWTSYDARMPTTQVPYPGWYDVGYVAAHPFFVLGTILLARRNRAVAERARLLLDALLVIGTALVLSWFFVLGPSIAGLAQSPGALAAFLAIYFPASDLLLLTVSVLLLFGSLSTRAQEPVLVRLCLGLSCLATADSLLGYFNLVGGFNSGTLLDLLWPLSLLIVGLAAIAYPRCVAQEQVAQAREGEITQELVSHFSQLRMTVQTIVPFLLALLACALLLMIIAPRSHNDLIVASLIVLGLVILVVIRQALTLLENNRLTMQVRSELVISRRALQVTQREAHEAERLAQENQAFAEGVKAIQTAHAHIARGDFSVRVPSLSGPLMPIIMSLNLMLDRLNILAERTGRYERLLQELPRIQTMIEALASNSDPRQTIIKSEKELQPVLYALVHIQRFLSNHWLRLFNITKSLEDLSGKVDRLLGEVSQALSSSDAEVVMQGVKLEQARRSLLLLRQELGALEALSPAVRSMNAGQSSFAFGTTADVQEGPVTRALPHDQPWRVQLVQDRQTGMRD
jgi:hypothetical protein